MSGKGELVYYTRLFAKGPLSPHEKAALKQQINAIIDAASGSITIESMVEVLSQNSVNEIVKELLDKVKPGDAGK
jgi:hypothetical protein